MWVQNISLGQSTDRPIILATKANAGDNQVAKLSKVDCAKECPCGVPTIPVPDQWLEVMVSGGFKVWHIIFIIIALVVTMVVVYCCVHRCRIPRTKQEIEADLMRSNMTNKFRNYIDDLPNEPATFIEVLKRVQEMEEKQEKEAAQESRDVGIRKRMGWLKLKGKGVAGDDIEAAQQKPVSDPIVETNPINQRDTIGLTHDQIDNLVTEQSTEIKKKDDSTLVNTKPEDTLTIPIINSKLTKDVKKDKMSMKKEETPDKRNLKAVIEPIETKSDQLNLNHHIVKHTKRSLSRSKLIRDKSDVSIDVVLSDRPETVDHKQVKKKTQIKTKVRESSDKATTGTVRKSKKNDIASERKSQSLRRTKPKEKRKAD